MTILPSLLLFTLPAAILSAFALPQAAQHVFDDVAAAKPHDPWNLTSLQNSTYHSMYHPLYEIDNFMEDLAVTYPELVQLVNIGHSAEGREMLAMRISKPPSAAGEDEKAHAEHVNKLGFVVSGAQHAREVRSFDD